MDLNIPAQWICSDQERGIEFSLKFVNKHKTLNMDAWK